ncbi:MAG: aminotransferase class IV [Bacteroidetes bacterium]|nr:aminotransferase class IV [Bacteroidota bacterium]
MNMICFNGKFLQTGSPILQVDNRGYRYGDGIFETMKVCDGQALLSELHFERMRNAFYVLQYQLPSFFTNEKLTEEILQLCKNNNCIESARVRLSFFRGNGGLFEGGNDIEYIIECWPLPVKEYTLNEIGLVVDFFRNGKKSCDIFSNLKSGNHLIYAMAAHDAKKNHLDDCLVQNVNDRIIDTAIANIFLIKNGQVFTPPLSEGCIAGVMRKYILQKAEIASLKILEVPISVEDILFADELFITNAIKGINWISQCGEAKYGNTMIKKIFTQMI